jgi:hypothetical protein
MASSTRHQIIESVKSRLNTISLANGYNTQPAVVADYEQAKNGTEQFAVYVNVGDESFPEAAIGNRFLCEIEVLVFGLVRRDDTGNPLLTDTDALLQDIRNAMMAYRASFQSDCGGAFKTFGTCETDEGALSQVDRAFFVQPLMFMYNAGTTF